jgi:DivIVA domain-containing protein
MRHLIFILIVALVVAGIAYCVAWLLTGRDSGLEDVEPDGRAVPLPATRPLVEPDIVSLRFDTVLRGYRMDQVDAALRRAAYDMGYKTELINVLEAEVEALRDGRHADAETLRRAREGAQAGVTGPPVPDEVISGDVPSPVDTPTEIGAPITRLQHTFDESDDVQLAGDRVADDTDPVDDDLAVDAEDRQTRQAGIGR